MGGKGSHTGFTTLLLLLAANGDLSRFCPRTVPCSQRGERTSKNTRGSFETRERRRRTKTRTRNEGAGHTMLGGEKFSAISSLSPAVHSAAVPMSQTSFLPQDIWLRPAPRIHSPSSPDHALIRALTCQTPSVSRPFQEHFHSRTPTRNPSFLLKQIRATAA